MVNKYVKDYVVRPKKIKAKANKPTEERHFVLRSTLHNGIKYVGIAKQTKLILVKLNPLNAILNLGA